MYTAANDNKINQLNSFLNHFQASNPNQNLKVILFDQDSKQVIQLCKQKKISIVRPSPVIDHCAKSIFKASEYKSVAKNWKRMRKLNCFLDAASYFIFLDINCTPLARLDPLIDAYIDLKKDILFASHSQAKKTLQVNTKKFLNLIDPAIGEGYDCSIITSKHLVLNESIFQTLKGQNLNKLIAKIKNPEHSYLAIIMALSNISHGLLTDSDEFRSHYSCASPDRASKPMLNFDHAFATIKNNRRKQNKVLITYKSTRSDMTNLPAEKLKIFKQLKSVVQNFSIKSKPESRTDLKIYGNKLIAEYEKQKPIQYEHQYTLKLYSPFRSGSNLIKAALEFNYANIHVLNTGDNHWKHAFHAQSKNYFGYIYCIRHPLNLIYSIRDYYYKVGRNICSHGQKENFFYQPITIYNEGVHRGRSPILFPNPVALINAWYFNYLHALKDTRNKSSTILYEHMMMNQEKSIKNIIQSMNLDVQSTTFSPINAKTRNLGDRRFNEERDLQGKIFDAKITLQRHKCGLSDTNLINIANKQDVDFILCEVDWSTCNKLGYDEHGLIKDLT